MDEHIAYIIADAPKDAHDIYTHWTFAGHEERQAYESWQIVFKGEADARHRLARHLAEAKPGQDPKVFKLALSVAELTLAPSRTGLPPYAEDDVITVYDSEYGIKYRARVTEVLLAGARQPWIVHFESLKPVEPRDSRHYVGSLEAADDGTSPNIVREDPR